ncbi:hypothetical protein FACS189419_03090 [Planctomycetales bacterium]|nr:hypothetical protein FACS189419_03090 [Planctomycetales bacterium]
MTRFVIFILLLVLVTGCSLLEKRERLPNLESTPPYYQKSDPLADAQVYHDKNVQSMAEGVHVVRNREMERLEAAGKIEKEDKEWEEDYKKTMERRAKWARFFKKGQDETLMMSDSAKEINKNLK